MARSTRAKRRVPSPSPQLPIVNTTGFAALPCEIYLEIMSYLPPLPVPVEEPTDYDSLGLRERRFTMHAVSQTCSSLRRVFLGFLWERIEVYDGMVTQDGPLPSHVPNPGLGCINLKVHRKYAEELVRQLETVTIRDPSLAQHVKVLNALVTDFSVKSVLQELARCIKLLPNLHTVQLDFGFDIRVQRVKETFSEYKYDHIRTVCLSPQATIFASACSNLRRVTAYEGRFWDTRINFAQKFANVETLGIIYAERNLPFQKIVDGMPKLRDITLDVAVLRGDPDLRSSNHYGTNLQFAQHLVKLRHLRTIRIKLNLSPMSIGYHRMAYWEELFPVSQEEMDAWVKKARQVLSKIPDNSDFVQRKVILTRPNGDTEVFNVRAVKSAEV